MPKIKVTLSDEYDFSEEEWKEIEGNSTEEKLLTIRELVEIGEIEFLDMGELNIEIISE